jgi:hypothetical protein
MTDTLSAPPAALETKASVATSTTVASRSKATPLCAFPRQSVWSTVVLFQRPFEPLHIELLSRRLIEVISNEPKARWMRQCLNKVPTLTGGRRASAAASTSQVLPQKSSWYWTESPLSVGELVRTQMLVPWEQRCRSERELREYLQDVIERESMPKEDCPQWQLTIIPSIASSSVDSKADASSSAASANSPRSAIIFRHHDWWCQDASVVEKFWSLLAPASDHHKQTVATASVGVVPSQSSTATSSQPVSVASMLAKMVDHSKSLVWSAAAQQARWTSEDRNCLTNKIQSPVSKPRKRLVLLTSLSEDEDDDQRPDAEEAESGFCPMWCESRPDARWRLPHTALYSLLADAAVLAKIVVGTFEYQHVMQQEQEGGPGVSGSLPLPSTPPTSSEERIHINWMTATNRQYQRVAVAKSECATMSLEQLERLLLLRFLFGGQSRTYRCTSTATSTITFKSSTLSWNVVALAFHGLAHHHQQQQSRRTSSSVPVNTSFNKVLSIMQFAPMAANKRGITVCVVPSATAETCPSPFPIRSFLSAPSVGIMCHWGSCQQPAKLIELIEDHLMSSSQ